MKVYTTASNAKRAATALAAKHDNLDVAEKMVPGEEGGFYATVHVNMGVASADVRAEAKVIPDPAKAVAPPVTETPKPDVLPLTDKDGKVGAVLDLNPNAGKNLRADGTEMSKDEVGTEARVVEPKANVPDAPKLPKDNKTTKAIEMMSAKDGATAEALIKALNWQKHTLRGFVSLQNSKHKRGIATIRKDGVTTYKIG